MNDITTNIYDLKVTAEYEYDPGEPEIRYYPGKSGCCPNGDGHPGEPESIELLAVWLEKDGKKLDLIDFLPADIIESIGDECIEDAHSKLDL